MGPIKNTIPKEKLRKLAGELLEMAAEEFSRHGCNDFDRPDYFTEEEWDRMSSELGLWNSEGRDEGCPLEDWVVMTWIGVLAEAGEL